MGWLTEYPGDVAGALTASAALTVPRTGGLAGPLECDSCQALFPQLPSLQACGAATPSQLPWTDPSHWGPSPHSLCSANP